MANINIPPTRSNLLRMKQELRFAKEGYEILDRKREVLTTELIQMAHDAQVVQEEVWRLVAEAYRAFEQAQLTMGEDHVKRASLAIHKTVDVNLKLRGVMGVPIPVIDASGALPETPYSLGDSKATLDEASAAFGNVLERVPELSELVTSVWRLAGELRKTLRRVNALQHIFIPDYEEKVEFIKSALEEREREETFRLKWLKTKMAKADKKRPERDYAQTQPFV